MNAIHGQDSWQAQHVSEEYADHTAWDVRIIVEMLQKFFDVSGAVSLPDLAEYEWRLDKVSARHAHHFGSFQLRLCSLYLPA